MAAALKRLIIYLAGSAGITSSAAPADIPCPMRCKQGSWARVHMDITVLICISAVMLVVSPVPPPCLQRMGQKYQGQQERSSGRR